MGTPGGILIATYVYTHSPDNQLKDDAAVAFLGAALIGWWLRRLQPG